MIDHWNTQQKAFATILLDGQLTPIVRRLLLLDDLSSSLRQSNESASANSANQGMEIERLKQVKQLLIHLRRSLEHIFSTVNEACNTTAYAQPQQSNETHKKLTNQLNGVSLPLLNMLQSNQQDPNATTDCIRGSAKYAIIEEASTSLAVLWRIARAANDSNDCIKSLALPILVSCAMALSTLEISRDFKLADVGKEKETPSANGAMDKGEDCAIVILQLIRTIFAVGHDNANELQSTPFNGINRCSSLFTAALSKEVGNAIGGSLVARLVLSCLSLLTQDNVGSGKSEIMRKPKEKSTTLQLESLKTMCAFLIGIPIQNLWKSMLPGCFAGLYRSVLTNLRYKSAASAHKVASGSTIVLSLLLKRSLSMSVEASCTNTGNESMMSALIKVVDRAKNTSRIKDKVSVSKPPPQSGEHGNSFIDEVNSRLPGPISVLLRMIPANKSRLVRTSGLHLCHVVLIDSRCIWKDDIAESLGKNALEYCLVLLSDDDVELRKSSSQLLASYKSHIGAESWRLRLSKSIVPLLELIEMLPVFAKSGRDVDVRNHLRLINGYLLMSFQNMENDFDMHECLKNKRKSDIGSALGCIEAMNVIKKSFGVVFTPDVDTITVKPVIENGLISHPNQLVTRAENGNFKYLYMIDETIELTKHTVHLLGLALGSKRSAFLIDGCFADVFQSCVESTARKIDDALGLSQPVMQQEWCGSCMFANEILIGICSPTNRSASEHRILKSLASAVLPILVSHPLWTLSTKFPGESPTETSNNDTDSTQSASRMRCNSVLVCSLMRFVGSIAVGLKDDMRPNLPIILVPLLERASTIDNHSSVQTCALETISEVTLLSGYSDVLSLLTGNFDYIMGHLSLRLRRHSKDCTPASRSLMGVVDVVLRCVNCDKNMNQSQVPVVGRILDCLINHFDRLTDHNRIQSIDVLCAFQSINAFMAASVHSQTKSHVSVTIESERENCSWKKLLDLGLGYHAIENSYDDASVIESDDGDAPGANGNLQPSTSVHSAETDEASRFAQEIAAINRICKRCAYLLCHQDLRVQVVCTEVLLSGFQSLGEISAYCRSVQGQSASNPLLPAIAEFWPSILARLKETCMKLRSKKMLSLTELSIRHMMAADQEKSPSDASLIVFLSKLLEIVSELCTISDGFFAGRFENDVYPILATILGDFIPLEIALPADNISSRRSALPVKRHSALGPALRCIKCVFSSSCRFALGRLISPCGTIILPLIAHKGRIGDETVDALKAMLTVDSDVLWRQIHKMSGKAFPGSKQEGCTDVLNKPALPFKSTSNAVMAQRACKLLEFIEHLPEQEV